jgi:hypothetical protein
MIPIHCCRVPMALCLWLMVISFPITSTITFHSLLVSIVS